MPEMKNNFQRGRMNKDLDERIVPDGEYRDALNVEIATEDIAKKSEELQETIDSLEQKEERWLELTMKLEE